MIDFLLTFIWATFTPGICLKTKISLFCQNRLQLQPTFCWATMTLRLAQLVKAWCKKKKTSSPRLWDQPLYGLFTYELDPCGPLPTQKTLTLIYTHAKTESCEKPDLCTPGKGRGDGFLSNTVYHLILFQRKLTNSDFSSVTFLIF